MTQSQALDILKLGRNVYLTGCAGSGKTYLLNQYIAYLKSHHVPVAITASTGIAATHMGGMTIHAWSGLGIRDVIHDRDLLALGEKRWIRERIENTKVLIIDEVSMLHHFRLDLVDKILRTLRASNEPFGGIQVVLCGDFFQLPPVTRYGEAPSEFIYKSESWESLGLTICYLHEQHRHNDEVSVSVLNDIRTNTISETTKNHLRSRYNKPPLVSIDPTVLHTHNANVDAINEIELGKLKGDMKEYQMSAKGKSHLVEALQKSCLAPERLRIKKDARVIFVKNNPDMGYMNGTLGTVVDITEEGPCILTVTGERIIAQPTSWIIEEEGKTKAQITQIPLRLAWAITVHKSQGMSLDTVEVDLSKCFEKGMGYVALSRMKSFQGLKLMGLNDIALQVHPEVLAFDRKLQQSSDQAVQQLQQLKVQEKTKLQETYLSSIAPIKKEKKELLSTYEKTRRLLADKHSTKAIADFRDMNEGTIISHIEMLLESKSITQSDIGHLKPDDKRLAKIHAAFENVYSKTQETKLSPVRDVLGDEFSYDQLRFARLFLPIAWE